jgi:hypothetical protein
MPTTAKSKYSMYYNVHTDFLCRIAKIFILKIAGNFCKINVNYHSENF